MKASPGRGHADSVVRRALVPVTLALVLLGCDEEPLDEQADEADTIADESDTSTDEGDTSTGEEGCDACPIHVDIDAEPGGDGHTWATARNDLRATVDELGGTGGMVWVAEGTYTPPDMFDVVLRMRPGLAIYGGFAGTETQLDQRDHLLHPTILQQTHPQASVVQVVDFTLETAPMVLDGFVITGDPGTPTPQRGLGIEVLGDVFDQVAQPQLYLHDLEIHGTRGALSVVNWTTLELRAASIHDVGSSRVDLQACKLEYSIVSPK